MQNTIMKVERPMYRVLATAGFFGPDHTLYDEGQEVYFDGEPNEELEPLNQAAHDKVVVYLEKLDTLGREAAAKANRPWAGRPRTLDGALTIASAIQKAEMGILGSKITPTAETIAKIEREAPEKAAQDTRPDTGLTEVKRGRGRPAGATNKPKTLSATA